MVRAAVQAEAGRPSLCDPHRERIEAKRETGLSAQRIYQDLVGEVGFVGSYQSVKRFVRRLRRQAPERVWRIEVAPGEEVQVDFGLGAPIVEADGRRRRPWVWRVVLSCSRKAYSEAVFQQSTENLIRCLEIAFRAFGGVARGINLDNLRAAVQRADWCDPELHPQLLNFCRHYGCALMPCRPRTPEHKGKTERGIGYLKGNALGGRVFTSLAAENEFLRHGEKTVADVRLHGTTRQQVAARFAQEQPALLPRPPDLFPCFQEGQRTLHRYLKPDLLCIDDFGMKHFPPKSAEARLELIVRRHQNRSPLLTSNRPIEEWGQLLGDVPAATAILDRFLEQAEIIPITARSYRWRHPRSPVAEPEKKATPSEAKKSSADSVGDKKR